MVDAHWICTWKHRDNLYLNGQGQTAKYSIILLRIDPKLKLTDFFNSVTSHLELFDYICEIVGSKCKSRKEAGIIDH